MRYPEVDALDEAEFEANCKAIANRNITAELRSRTDYMTSADVIKLLRVTRRTLYTWIARGVIPAHRVGISYRFDPRTIADWLSNHRN